MAQNSGANSAFPSPFTIISSNPTYMSYRDPAPSATPFASFMNSYSSSSRDGSVQPFTPQQQAYQNFLSPDVVMNDFGATPTPLESANYTFSSAGNENVNLDEFYSGQIRGGVSLASFGINASPSSNAQTVDKLSPQPSQGRCNKEAVAQAIESGGQSVFVKEALKQQLGGKHAPPIAQSDSNIDAVMAFQTIRSYAEFKACTILVFISSF
jgi:hypothetical protein